MVNVDYDKPKGLLHLHLANTFSKTEYHLTIPKLLFDEMLKNMNIIETENLVKSEVILDEIKRKPSNTEVS